MKPAHHADVHPALHPEFRAFFDVHHGKSQVHRRKAHDQLRPVAAISAEIDAYLGELEQHLLEAHLAEHDVALDHDIAFLQRTIEGVRSRVSSFRREARAMAGSLTELNEHLDRGKLQALMTLKHYAAFEAKQAAEATPESSV